MVAGKNRSEEVADPPVVFGSSGIVLSEAFHAIRATFLPNEQRFRTVNHVLEAITAEQEAPHALAQTVAT